MEKRKRVGGDGGNRAMEENTMAILDTSGFRSSKLSHHLNDDRLAFLEAVRTASLLPENGSAPTRKMFAAIFHILKDADSLDLIIESYQLLVELDKRFPRVYLSKREQLDSSSPSEGSCRLIMVEEAWLPFDFGWDNSTAKGDTTNRSKTSVDSLGFHALVQEIADMRSDMKSEAVGTKSLKNMLLLQYLISVLEGDFLPRNCTYQENMNWTILRESLLNILLGSRKIVYKGLMKDCLSIMCNISQSTIVLGETSCHENYSGEMSCEIDSSIALALREVQKSTCTSLKNFFLMILELDSSRGMADQQSLTTRADGVRTPLVDIILDELIYNNDALCSFLQVFDPRHKIKIIVQYFQKYIPKASVQTRRSTCTINTESFDGVLKCLSNRNSTKSIIKKLNAEVVQLLLAYAFQAYLALSNDIEEGSPDTVEGMKSNSVAEVCENIVSAFNCLRQEDPDTEILGFGKEALFMAAAILSTKS